MKEAPRQEATVRVVTPADAVEVVPARPDGEVYRRPAREPLLGIEGVGYYVHFLDGLRRRHVNSVRRQPRVNDTRTVNFRVVLQARHAVDVVGDGPLRVAGG